MKRKNKLFMLRKTSKKSQSMQQFVKLQQWLSENSNKRSQT